ncbi:MAG: SDR family NAD(P)-dependent oxidoreductase [Gammaproteobacteria bacterium]|nr:SDR family NAD(P)-dependent oxidoreductase [Gammaproteobacteria bacterium]
MKDFGGKIAVVTGGGTGMGRALVRQLIAEGCSVATCDIIAENLAETVELASAEAAQGARVTSALCDVAIEDEVIAFRDHVRDAFETEHINLLFNNAGIGGGGSFIEDSRDEWERTFNICWFGVYYTARAFREMLVASDEGHMINTSSVNGFRASLGGNIPHTAYSAAKFAVKGFSEALINDFRFNAPHLKVSVVMPGHVGTEIGINTGRILGYREPKDWTTEDIARARKQRATMGVPDETLDSLDDDAFRAEMQRRRERYREAPVSPAQAAEIILDGVRREDWRILVGKDAVALDEAVRQAPLDAYDLDFSAKVWASMAD